MGVEHKIVTLDVDLFRGSALTDKTVAVPDFQGTKDIPVTYVPARNTIFLSMALGFAESIGARDLFIGVSSIDYSHYPDCRPEFIQAFQTLAKSGNQSGRRRRSFYCSCSVTISEQGANHSVGS